MERIPYISLLIGIVLIYLPRQVVGAEMKKQHGTYDNNDPRGQQAKLEGRGRRALGAHHNAIEALPLFTAAIFSALARGVNMNMVAVLCGVWVVARTVYVVAYLGDQASLRSSMWGLSLLSVAALLIFAIIGP
jgi:uncharacterized MAPEG superfamily protein